MRFVYLFIGRCKLVYNYLNELAAHVAYFSINEQDYSVLLRYFSFGLYRLKSYRVRFEQEKNALFVLN